MNKQEYKKPELFELTSNDTHGKMEVMTEQGNGSQGWGAASNLS